MYSNGRFQKQAAQLILISDPKWQQHSSTDTSNNSDSQEIFSTKTQTSPDDKPQHPPTSAVAHNIDNADNRKRALTQDKTSVDNTDNKKSSPTKTNTIVASPDVDTQHSFQTTTQTTAASPDVDTQHNSPTKIQTITASPDIHTQHNFSTQTQTSAAAPNVDHSVKHQIQTSVENQILTAFTTLQANGHDSQHRFSTQTQTSAAAPNVDNSDKHQIQTSVENQILTAFTPLQANGHDSQQAPTFPSPSHTASLDEMSTPYIINQAMTLVNDSFLETLSAQDIRQPSHTQTPRQLFEGDLPFSDLFQSPGTADRRVTQAWDRKLDAINKKLSTIAKQQQEMMKMLTYLMRKTNASAPEWSQEPVQQPCLSDMPSVTHLETSTEDVFNDIPHPSRMSIEQLQKIKRESNSIGNLAALLTVRLFPELFTSENLRFRYNYNGVRYQKEPLDAQRKRYLQRYMLYFFPQLSDPKSYHSNVVDPVNEILRRKNLKAKNNL